MSRGRRRMKTGSLSRDRRWGAALVVAAAILLILRAAPLVRAYLVKLRGLHAPSVLVLCAAAAVVALGALTLGLRRWPRATLSGLGVLALLMVLLSGNLGSLARAGGVLAGTWLLGDLVFRLFVGSEAEAGDLTAALAAGLVVAGLLILALAESGALSGVSLSIGAGALLAARWRRVPRLVRLARASARLPRGDAPPLLEAAWLAFAAAVLLACWAAAQAPDTSWDALSYHLPQARDIARHGRVDALAELAPQSQLWHNHDAYLALGFFAGGEPVVRFLQFAVGAAVFGAAASLARRLDAGATTPLLVLALAAFPTAMLQLHAAYVDWPAALLVTASAAQLAGAHRAAGSGRARLAGLFLGGAIVIKIFALFALPALALLVRRQRLRAGAVVGAILCVALPLGAWMAWSQRHADSLLSPYADSPGQLLARVAGGHFFTASPASGSVRPGLRAAEAARALVRLPYDLVFHSSRFEGNGDGYNGILVLLLALGVAGWGAAGALRFLIAALPFLIPWSLLFVPSIRFLLPVYPLYAVFAAGGLRRLTGRFAGAAGAAAGAAVLAAAALFPVQLGSSGAEWRLAFGRLSPEGYLAVRLPSWPLWRFVSPDDRVLFVGENDRFHCPGAAAWRSNFGPISSWADGDAWSRGLAELRLTQILWRVDREPNLPPGLPEHRLRPIAASGPAFLYGLSP